MTHSLLFLCHCRCIMLRLTWLSLLLLSHTVAGDGNAVDDAKTCPDKPVVIVYPNGGGDGKTPGRVLGLDELDSTKSYYTEQGLKLNDTSTLTNGTVLLQAPTKPGTHFVYPALEVGRKITTAVKSPKTGKPIELQVLSHSPRVFYVKDFMTDKETDVLIDFAVSDKNPYKMAQSTGGTHKSWEQGGRNDVLKTRTSMNAFDISTPTSFAIKQRAFDLLRMPRLVHSMADGIQVLRYELGQAYVAHHDYFPAKQSPDFNWDPSQGGSNRFATVFLYLSDVEEGGQTCFPRADKLQEPKELAEHLTGGVEKTEVELEELIQHANFGKNSWEAKLTRDCYNRFSVKPRKGDAVLFYSQTPNGDLDESSIHGAGPVLKGTKWGANLWVWNACRYSQCEKDPMNPAKELDFQY